MNKNYFFIGVTMIMTNAARLLLFMFFLVTFSFYSQTINKALVPAASPLIIPAGVTTLTANCWGAGGGGGGSYSISSGGGGGGGGGFRTGTVTVTPVPANAQITYVVGQGGTGGAGGILSATNGADGADTKFATTIIAEGGEGGKSTTSSALLGLGGLGRGGAGGDSGFDGGHGAPAASVVAVGLVSGGGGGGAGTTANGSNGNTGVLYTVITNTGGAGGAVDGGKGGNGLLLVGAANNGDNYGGGGGGGITLVSLFGNNGGNGGNGQIKVLYTCPTYSITNNVSATNACASSETSTVTLSSSAAGLPIGTYTVFYDRSLPSGTNLQANMVVSSAGTGTFSVLGLTSSGISTITIKTLQSVDCISTISANNTVDISVSANPSAPTGAASQSFCTGSSPKVANLTATGTAIQWYASSTGGTALATSVSLVNGTHYYATQTVNGCESTSRFDVTATINATPPAVPTGIAAQSFCSGASPTVANLTTATGSGIKWYAAASGGTVLASGTALVSGNYYASASISSCESTSRFNVTATVNTTPVIANKTPAAICSGGSFAVTPTNGTDIVPASTTYTWAAPVAAGITGLASGTTASSISGTLTNTTNAAVNVVYAVTPIGPSCTGSPFTVTVIVNPKPSIANVTPAAICSGGSFAVTPTNGTDIVPASTTYTWTAPVVAGITGLASGTTASSISGTLTNTTNAAVNVVYAVTPIGPLCTGSTFTVSVAVNPAPAITTSPSSQSICETGNTSFTVTASGSGLTYQWQLSTNGGAGFSNLSNSGVYSNVTAATMNITAATIGMNNYQYRCVVSGTCPSPVVSNAATLIVNPDIGGISLNGGSPIASNSVVLYCASTTASFRVDPVAGATNYIWILPAGWTVLSGGTTNTITVTTGTIPQTDDVVSVMADNIFCPSHIRVTLSSIPPSALTISKTDPICAIPTGTVTAVPPSSVTGILYTLIKNNVVIGTNTTGQFTGLAGGDYKMTYQIDSGCHSDISNSVTIVPLVTKTWDGSSWSPESPTLDDTVIFTGNAIITTPVNACWCQINSLVNVVVGTAQATNENAVLTIQNGLNVQGSLTFENNASLVQLNDNAVNSGNITYKRTTSSVKDFDYVYWSSPVEGQLLGVLSPSSDKYWSFNNMGWAAETAGSIMTEGKGYIARVPRYTPFQSVEFIGKPNNGSISIASQGVMKSNLIGNPYASAISANKFITDNALIIDGALYFWTHNTARVLNANGTQLVYTSDDYATYNFTGAVATTKASKSTDSNGDGIGDGVLPSGKIAAGQSFFVVSKTAGNFTFTNSMRIFATGSNSQFFKQANNKIEKIENNRVWLNLTNDGGAFKQLLVGYVTGATNDFDDLYDAASINGNAYIDFFSLINSKNYTIQGRGLPFNPADEVLLGYKTTIAGTFQISIEKADGVLENQAVYLEDKTANTIYDLTKGSYSFTTAIGTFNDRFVMRYTNNSLGKDDFTANGKEIVVSLKNSQIKINSFDQIIFSAKVYDLKGSLLYEKNKVNKYECRIDNLVADDQLLIVMAILENGKKITEKIIFN